MDKQSLFGIALGIGAVLGGQMLEGGDAGALVQLPALLIVLGGTLGAVLLQTPFTTFKRGVVMLGWVFFPPKVDFQRQIDHLVQWSHFSRREGLLALENFANQTADPFARKGLQLLVDGIDGERLRDILETGYQTQEAELKQSARIWEAAGGYSPTIGILGAVLGLIHIMNNLANPNELGTGIAIAFVATVYGVGLANLVYLPIANKLKVHIGRVMREREIVMEGLLGIATGDNPRIIESRLKGYLEEAHMPKTRGRR